MAKPRLVKLVRDDVGKYLPANDSRVSYDVIEDRQEFLRQLRGKLVEEALEYLLDPSPEELADVYEVVCALAQYDLELRMGELPDIARIKRDSHGGFDTGTGMYVQTLEGEHGT